MAEQIPQGTAVPEQDFRPEEAEIGFRRPTGWQAALITVLAISFSLFHLYTAGAGMLVASLQRSVHLTFGIVLAYLLYPLTRRESREKIPWHSFLLAAAAGAAAFYIFAQYDELVHRIGSPTKVDLMFGAVLVVLLLEAVRRSVGPALAIIATLFIAYGFLGPYMPGLLAHRGYSFRRIIDQLYLTNEGIFGIPLGVSSTFVFLFVLFGALLQQAGGGEYFTRLAFSVLGHFRGGPAKAAVVASGLMGTVSGSSIANTVTTGTFTIPLMKRVGFPAVKAGAIEVTASTNGQLMPPIMGAAAFIMAEFLGISYFNVVVAAAIPAILTYVGLLYIVHLEALKLDIRGLDRSELPNPVAVFWSGAHYLIPIAGLLYSLLILRRTPVTAAFQSIVLVILVLLLEGPVRVLARRMRGDDSGNIGAELKEAVRKLLKGMEIGGRNMVGIAVATATAGIVVGIITLTGLGLRLAEIIDTLAQGQLFPMLLVTALACIILGLGLPTTANYVVMATLAAPALLLIAPDLPPLAVHLFVFFFGIMADETPPVGLAAYAVAPISGASPLQTGVQSFIYSMRTAILPFMFIFSPELILIGVESFWHGLQIALTALIGMFAFAAATQGYMRTFTTWPERIVLLLAAFGLIRPGTSTDLLGIALFAAVYAFQTLRMRQRPLRAGGGVVKEDDEVLSRRFM